MSNDRADHYINGVFFETLQLPKLRDRNELAVDVKSVESLALCPARHVSMKTFARFHQWRQDLQSRKLSGFRSRFDPFHNGSCTLFFHSQITVRAKLRSCFCKQKAKKMINLGDRRHRRFASAACDSLLNGDGWRQSADQIDIWFFELLDELPRIRRHTVEKPALALGKQDVERNGRFTGAAQAGDNHELFPGNF